MNWKTNLRVNDLDFDQRIEVTCRECGHVHYLTRKLISGSSEREFLYLDEVERETVCRARGCRGAVRIALVRNGEASGFVGGLA